MNKEAMKYAMCSECGWFDGEPDHSVARLAFDVAMDTFPPPLDHFAYGSDVGEIHKRRKRETRNLRERVKCKTMDIVRKDPKKYGFGGFIGMVLLAIQIYSIVKAVVEWLMERRYAGLDDEIQAIACPPPEGQDV